MKRVSVGDKVRITGHNYFHGGSTLPIGSELTVNQVEFLHNAVVHQFGPDSSMNWWILPEDYEII